MKIAEDFHFYYLEKPRSRILAIQKNEKKRNRE